jgi:hypothetical protein
MARARLFLLSDPTVQALITAMGEKVAKVLAAIGEAQALHADGEQTETVARLHGVDAHLQDAVTLHGAIVILHHQR